MVPSVPPAQPTNPPATLLACQASTLKCAPPLPPSPPCPCHVAGAATALALLDLPPSACLPPLECLFTVDEETGLTGASNISPTLLQGRVMLNLDTEEWVSGGRLAERTAGGRRRRGGARSLLWEGGDGGGEKGQGRGGGRALRLGDR